MDIVVYQETAYEHLRGLATRFVEQKGCALTKLSNSFTFTGPNGRACFQISNAANQVHIRSATYTDLYVPFDEAVAHLRYLGGE